MNAKKILSTLIDRIKESKKTAVEISAQSGLTRQTVSAIINGKNTNPRILTLQKISETVGDLHHD